MNESAPAPMPKERAIVRVLGPCFKSPIGNLLAFLVALIVAAGAVAATGEGWLYPAAFFMAASWYGLASHRLASTGQRVESVVVSEQIIAGGIASLIGHVTYAVISAGVDLGGSTEVPVAKIMGAAHIFAEGLACAAIAPLVAMVVRFADDPSARVNEELDHLTQAAVAMNEFSKKVSTLGRKMERFANAMDTSVIGYEAAVDNVMNAFKRFEGDIRAHSGSVTSELDGLDAKVRILADTLERTTADLRRVGGDVSSVYVAADDAIRGLAGRTKELGDSMQSSTELLRGLQELIASINDFVRPQTPQEIARMAGD